MRFPPSRELVNAKIAQLVERHPPEADMIAFISDKIFKVLI